MTYQLTVKAVLICTLTSSSFYSVWAASDAEKGLATGQVVSEKIARAPLMGSDYYESYKIEDNALNLTYRTLSKSLSKNNQALLKQTQRRWIKWRDEMCDIRKGKAGCTIATCYADAHDDCIIALTADRNNELLEFIKDTDAAAKRRFAFETD